MDSSMWEQTNLLEKYTYDLTVFLWRLADSPKWPEGRRLSFFLTTNPWGLLAKAAVGVGQIYIREHADTVSTRIFHIGASAHLLVLFS